MGPARTPNARAGPASASRRTQVNSVEQVEAEQSRTIARPAAEVWRALATLKGAAMPGIVERMDTRDSPAGGVVQRIQFSDSAYIDQRLVDRDDEARVLRFRDDRKRRNAHE